MDLPVSDLGPVKDSGPSFPCSLCDSELVHKLAQLLLPGLATACVDHTSGDLFKTPSSVAVDLRKEMVDHLLLRSETYVAETFLNPDAAAPDPDAEPPSDDPADIVSDLMEEFTASKRKLWARVSSWLLSDSREDKIDDFVQEMEISSFWLIDRRESVAETLVRNLDYKNKSHCTMTFDDPQKLVAHKEKCDFRPVNCANDGCKVKFCAVHQEQHDSVCPYKVLQCEQKCEERILRREMDRHCVTVCSMRMANCPFYQIGCQSAFPHCTLKQHCMEFVRSHLFYVMQVVHKNEDLLADELKRRVELMVKSEFRNELSEALDVRSLTLVVKKVEAKMKNFEHDISDNMQKEEEPGVSEDDISDDKQKNEEAMIFEHGISDDMQKNKEPVISPDDISDNRQTNELSDDMQKKKEPVISPDDISDNRQTNEAAAIFEHDVSDNMQKNEEPVIFEHDISYDKEKNEEAANSEHDVGDDMQENEEPAISQGDINDNKQKNEEASISQD